MNGKTSKYYEGKHFASQKSAKNCRGVASNNCFNYLVKRYPRWFTKTPGLYFFNIIDSSLYSLVYFAFPFVVSLVSLQQDNYSILIAAMTSGIGLAYDSFDRLFSEDSEPRALFCCILIGSIVVTFVSIILMVGKDTPITVSWAYILFAFPVFATMLDIRDRSVLSYKDKLIERLHSNSKGVVTDEQ